MITRRIVPTVPLGFGDSPISALAEEVNRLMETWAAPLTTGFRPAPTFPALNMWEDRENVYVEAELAGWTMSDLDVTMVGQDLTISGNREATPAPEGAVFHRRERPAGIGGRFSRTIRLPMPVNGERVTATLEHGVLLITLPKAEEARARTIQVKARG
jgi:HSP20 family protein